jgi:hypothetical protein
VQCLIIKCNNEYLKHKLSALSRAHHVRVHEYAGACVCVGGGGYHVLKELLD